MIGAIAGDVIGSVYEFHGVKTTEFPLFGPGVRYTDDTVLTVAVAQAILAGKDYGNCIRDFAERHPGRGYGASFAAWVRLGESAPYNSFGNGSAMRVSPVGFAFNSQEHVLREAGKSAACTHNHPEGIRGAQTVALAIFMARTGSSKNEIRSELVSRFGYDLNRTLDQIRPGYEFDVTCQGSVPEAIIAFLESTDYEDAVRKAVSLGGDADTQACITGGIAQAFYGGVPERIVKEAQAILPPEFLDVIERFEAKYRAPVST